MGSVYLRGQPVAVSKTFFVVNPLTQVGTPTNPDTVTFTVLDPDDVATEYLFGDAAEVTNPAVGVFLLQIAPPEPVGAYKWRCASPPDDASCVDAEEGAFDVIESGVLPPDPPTVAVSGPCSSWINGDDVANQGPAIPGIGSDTYLLDDVAYDASYVLWEASGRQYDGVCTTTVRPCTQQCYGYNGATWGTPFYWTYSYMGWGWGWSWWNETSGLYGCGCGQQSYVRLSGYPVREILSVKVGGVELPEFDTDAGFRNWRLDGRRDLVRMDTPGDPPTPNAWPNCQNLDLDDDQPQTFSIKYTYGADVPSIGRMAAVQLARELWLSMNGGDCTLSNKVTRIVRQGITIERVTPIAQLLREGGTGLVAVDMFLAAVNPYGMRRPPAVFSPDLQTYAQKVGQ